MCFISDWSSEFQNCKQIVHWDLMFPLYYLGYFEFGQSSSSGYEETVIFTVLFPLLIFQCLKEIIKDYYFILLCKCGNGMFICTINRKGIFFENKQVIRVDV